MYSAVPQTCPPFAYLFLEVKFSFFAHNVSNYRFSDNREEQSSLPESEVVVKHQYFRHKNFKREVDSSAWW